MTSGRQRSSPTIATTTRAPIPARPSSADITFWQAGIIQKFEKADINLYAVFQYADGSFIGNAATAASGAPVGKTSIDGFQELVTGAKINF